MLERDLPNYANQRSAFVPLQIRLAMNKDVRGAFARSSPPFLRTLPSSYHRFWWHSQVSTTSQPCFYGPFGYVGFFTVLDRSLSPNPSPLRWVGARMGRTDPILWTRMGGSDRKPHTRQHLPSSTRLVPTHVERRRKILRISPPPLPRAKRPRQHRPLRPRCGRLFPAISPRFGRSLRRRRSTGACGAAAT